MKIRSMRYAGSNKVVHNQIYRSCKNYSYFYTPKHDVVIILECSLQSDLPGKNTRKYEQTHTHT